MPVGGVAGVCILVEAVTVLCVHEHTSKDM